jgi:hypothetical protein
MAKMIYYYLDISGCVGYGYDKASAMSGENAGAAAYVQKSAFLADYYHCVSHAANLSCSKCTQVSINCNAHDTMAEVINNFTSSATRASLLRKHAGNDPDGKTGKFVERHTSVLRFWNSILVIAAALEEQQTWSDREARTKANAVLSCLQKTEMLVGLACLKSVYSVTKPLSQALQLKAGDLV